MYRQFFGLTELPFKSTPNTKLFFGEASRQAIFEALLYTIHRGDGIIKVTGEVGCGKTMMLRMVAEHLENEFELVYLNSPNLSPKDLLYFISSELNLALDYQLPKIAILDLLKKKFIDLYSQQKKLVLLIDESQSISKDSLEELRLLSNLETSNDKLVQIVFFGQPEFDQALERQELRQLKSRITYAIELPRFSPQEVCLYLNYRLRLAGYRGLDLFDLSISKAIHKLSGGYPRAINEVADKVLMSMYGAGDKKAKKKHLKSVVEFRSNYFISSFVVVIVLISFVVGVYGYSYFSNSEKSDFVSKLYPIVSEKNKVVQQPIEMFDELRKDAGDKRPSLVEANDETLVIELPNVEEKSVKRVVIVQDLLNALIEKDTDKAQELIFELGRQSFAIISKSNAGENLIQLATVNLTHLQPQLKLFLNDPSIQNNLLIFPEIKDSKKNLRIRFFFNQLDEVETLAKLIEAFSPNVKQSKPYILPVSTLKTQLEKFKPQQI